ncbi:hypothetical protein BXZ70DRAFT_396625 [Cristinia sonorae]|uniref:Uncharacterized protein n=1 Tax=Cristinia sonorae TaxID=1940300 RepID=A0A8K0UXZ1_9AGAR|nr:hypothetical protein BXZ70DRAFT_396625 [Cristinia sonorae]
MADPCDLDLTDSPPPPAYELTEQEFDLKTEEVIQATNPGHASSGSQGSWDTRSEVSAGTSSRSSHNDYAYSHGHRRSDAGSRERGSSASSSSQKERPRWLAHAGLVVYNESEEGESLSRSGTRADERRRAPFEAVGPPLTGPPYGANTHVQTPSSKEKERPQWLRHTGLVVRNPAEANVGLARSGTISSLHERERTPPPVFEAVGPSLDGPPYEPSVQEITLTYNGGGTLRPSSRPDARQGNYGSPSQSNVSQPRQLSPSQPRRRLPTPQSSPPQQYSPSIAAPSARVGVASPMTPPPGRTLPEPRTQPSRASPSPRPPTIYNPPVGRTMFDPQVAYPRKPAFEPIPETSTHINAAAFYNSAVSSHISTPSSQRTQSYASYVDSNYGLTVPDTSYRSPSHTSMYGSSRPTSVFSVSSSYSQSSTSSSGSHYVTSPQSTRYPASSAYGHQSAQPNADYPPGAAPPVFARSQQHIVDPQPWAPAPYHSPQSNTTRPW